MSFFKPINSRYYTVSKDAKATPDHLYWRRLGVPVLVKEFGTIDYVDFSPMEPYYFAVTCSVRVQIYNPITKLVVKNLSRFQESAYGGTFRNDGKLLVAGDEEGLVKLFDVSSKNILRLFKGHKGAVHRAAFTQDSVHICSFSDDKMVKVWDLSTEKVVCDIDGHTDYVRAGCTSPVSPNLLISAGYDHKIRMHDTRVASGSVLEVNHESPVESVLYLPSGGIFVSAGGTDIKVWDAMGGGKLLTRLAHHHKTVTCLKLANGGRRLLSGSLDHTLKIYDVSNYECVHSINYPNSVLSLGISADDETLVAGMVDGLVSIRRMESEKDEKKEEQIDEKKWKIATEHVDEVVPEHKKMVQEQVDRYLRTYEYSKALDCCLTHRCVTKFPHLTVSVMHELIRRKGLARAFSGRSHKSLAQLLSFCNRYISDYRFTRVLLDAVNILLDVYEDTMDTFPKEILNQFNGLAKRLKQEETATYGCLKVQGAMDLLISNASYVSKRISKDAKATPDHLYWRRLGVPVLVKEFGTIDYVDFSPVEPYYFAVTCSVRVQIYNPITKLVLLSFCNRYISDYRFTRVLLDAVNILLDVYEDTMDTFPKDILNQFNGLVKRLKQEETVTYGCLKVQGAMDLLISNASYVSKKNFCNRYISDYRFTRVLLDAVNILLDVYEDTMDTFPKDILNQFNGLVKRLKQEETVTYGCLKVQGAMDLLISNASYVSKKKYEDDLKQSENAKKLDAIKVF
uniref:U3 small nucleolar RNA-associated protein 15 homolog n=1 Tax=Lutzomyia longipalpis TaxID=7200 RepID=A0A7G3B0D7_LUTLO